MPFDVGAAYRAGDPPKIPGVGAAIDAKIAELATTGRMGFYERLREEVPPALVDLLRVPGVGPRTVRLLYENLGIENLEDLRHAAEAGHLRTVRGLSERTESSILAGIQALEAQPRRLLLGSAREIVDSVMDELRVVDGVTRLEAAGSFRRRRETIGDLDILAETSAPDLLMGRFADLGRVDRVLNRGGHKAAVKLMRGPQVDLMVMPPGEAGTYLIHFTGSKEHNVRLRGRARDRGWSLSEKGYVRLGENGEILSGPAADLHTFATEEEAYGFLDLPFIEPELREDRGEIEAALEGRLPQLVRPEDLRGDLHTHSEWSDGVEPIEVMAQACRRRGYEYQVLTDHTISLAIAHGLRPDQVEEQREIIRRLNEQFASEEADRRPAAGRVAERVPAAAWLRARDPRRWAPRLPRRAARALRPRRRIAARLAPTAARAADRARPDRDPLAARRRDRAPVGSDDPVARRPRPRLGRRVPRGRPDGHRARDERLAPPARPRRHAGPPGGRGRLPARRSTPMRTTCASSTTSRGR